MLTMGYGILDVWIIIDTCIMSCNFFICGKDELTIFLSCNLEIIGIFLFILIEN